MSGEPRTSADYAAAYASWHGDSPVPATSTTRLSLQLGSLRALSTVRRQVQEFLLSSLDFAREDDVPVPIEDAVGQAVLVIDELTSNALRHGSLVDAMDGLDLTGEYRAWLPVPAEVPAGGSVVVTVVDAAGAATDATVTLGGQLVG